MEIKRGIRPWDYCVPDEGESHDIPVVKGDSAYDIAVLHGFEGTEEEWLASLNGKSAYEIAVEHGYQGTEEEWVAEMNPDRFMKLEGGNNATGDQNFEGNVAVTTLTTGTITPTSSGATIGKPNNWFGKIYTLGGLMQRMSGGTSFKLTPRLNDSSETNTGIFAIKIPDYPFSQYKISLAGYGADTNYTINATISLAFDVAQHTLRTTWSSAMCQSIEPISLKVASKTEQDGSTGFYILFGDTDTVWGQIIPDMDCLVTISNYNDLMYISNQYVPSILDSLDGFTILLEGQSSAGGGGANWDAKSGEAGYVENRPMYRDINTVTYNLGNGSTLAGDFRLYPDENTQEARDAMIGTTFTRDVWFSPQGYSGSTKLECSIEELLGYTFNLLKGFAEVSGPNFSIDLADIGNAIVTVSAEITGYEQDGNKYVPLLSASYKITPIIFIEEYRDDTQQETVWSTGVYRMAVPYEDIHSMEDIYNTLFPDLYISSLYDLTYAQQLELKAYTESYIAQHPYTIGNSTMGYDIAVIPISRGASAVEGFTFYLSNPSTAYKSYFTIAGKTNWESVFAEVGNRTPLLYDGSHSEPIYSMDQCGENSAVYALRILPTNISTVIEIIYSDLDENEYNSLYGKMYNATFGDLGVTSLGTSEITTTTYHKLDEKYLPDSITPGLIDSPKIIGWYDKGDVKMPVLEATIITAVTLEKNKSSWIKAIQCPSSVTQIMNEYVSKVYPTSMGAYFMAQPLNVMCLSEGSDVTTNFQGERAFVIYPETEGVYFLTKFRINGLWSTSAGGVVMNIITEGGESYNTDTPITLLLTVRYYATGQYDTGLH